MVDVPDEKSCIGTNQEDDNASRPTHTSAEVFSPVAYIPAIIASIRGRRYEKKLAGHMITNTGALSGYIYACI